MTTPTFRALVGDSHRRAHRRSRLLSRMLVAAERPANESYRLILPESRIEYVIGDTITTWGEVLLLGTHSIAAPTWRWGWEDSRIPESSRQKLRTIYDASGGKAEAALREALASGDGNGLHDLCDYLSEAAGFLAAFPAETEHSTTWVAVNPSLRPDWPSDSPNNTWCDTCGVASVHARQLFRGALGSVCDACIHLALDVIDAGGKPADLEEEVHPTMPPCILRGDFVPRIMTTYSAISYSAALQVAAMPVFERTP